MIYVLLTYIFACIGYVTFSIYVLITCHAFISYLLPVVYSSQTVKNDPKDCQNNVQTNQKT